MRTVLALCLGLVFAFLTPHSACAVPELINHQGVLTDPGTGDPIVGTTPVVISLFQGGTAVGGGTIVYTENATLMTDIDGLFNHLIGSQATNIDDAHTLSASDFETGQPVWLEFQIGGSPLLPRSAVVSTPYALHAATASSVTSGCVRIQGVANEFLADAGNSGFAWLTVTVNGPSGPIAGLLDTDFGIASPIIPSAGSALTKDTFSPAPVDGVYSYRIVPAVGTWLAGTYHVSIAVSTPDGEAVTIVKLTVDL